jgi:hypothetical protein
MIAVDTLFRAVATEAERLESIEAMGDPNTAMSPQLAELRSLRLQLLMLSRQGVQLVSLQPLDPGPPADG